MPNRALIAALAAALSVATLAGRAGQAGGTFDAANVVARMKAAYLALTLFVVGSAGARTHAAA